jgi:hypothetical protein
MIIEYLTPLRTEFHLSPKRNKRWTVHEGFVFAVNGEKFEAPEGFWTDFASIPRLVWPIIAPDEIGYGPIPHDLGYFTGAHTKEYWDDVLWNCMVKDGIAPWKQTAVFKAVDWFGGWAWDRYRKANTKNLYVRNPHTQIFEILNWRMSHEDRFVHRDQ